MKLADTESATETDRSLLLSSSLPAKITGSHLPVDLILLVVRFYLDAAMSLRAASAAAEISIDIYCRCNLTPRDAIGISNNTVQNMVLRIGLHEISRPKEYAQDWIWIVDHTICVGTTKCFLVLGIRQCDFAQLNRPLEHRDMQVLALIPVEQSNGLIVHRQFNEIANACGVPLCILSDHGSDLKKGGELFRQEHPSTLLCYDIVHAVSRMLQRILDCNSNWEEYRKACCKAANKVRQSSLAHLKPPKPKTKARYMNVDPEIDWGEKTLGLLDRADQKGLTETQQQSLDGKKLESSFGWLKDFRVCLTLWSLLCDMGRTACSVVRRHGYTSQLGHQMRLELPVSEDETVTELAAEIFEFCDRIAAQFSEGERVPGSSEVIESAIGIGKRMMGEATSNGMTRQVLAMAAAVVPLAATRIQESLAACRIKHIAQWCQKHLKISLKQSRRRDLSPPQAGTKPAPT